MLDEITPFARNADLGPLSLRASVSLEMLSFLEKAGVVWIMPAPIAGYREYVGPHPVMLDLAALWLFDGLKRLLINGS